MTVIYKYALTRSLLTLALPEGAVYRGTAQLNDGRLVWHLFEGTV